MAVLNNQSWPRPFVGAALVAVASALAACAPMPGQNNPASNAASAPVAAAASSPAAQPASAPAAAPTGANANGDNNPKGVQEIIVGGAPGYRVTLHMMPPAQVCDTTAFVDGVRYGYASTWNGLVAASGGAGAAHRPVFDPSSAGSMDDRYKLQWNGGSEPANACAAYGYQIGKVMGTRQAYVDARGTS